MIPNGLSSIQFRFFRPIHIPSISPLIRSAHFLTSSRQKPYRNNSATKERLNILERVLAAGAIVPIRPALPPLDDLPDMIQPPSTLLRSVPVRTAALGSLLLSSMRFSLTSAGTKGAGQANLWRRLGLPQRIKNWSLTSAASIDEDRRGG